jgi:hypothetical protein
VSVSDYKGASKTGWATHRRLNEAEEDELEPGLHAALEDLLAPLADALFLMLARPPQQVVDGLDVPAAADPGGADVRHVVRGDDLFEAGDDGERERLLREREEELGDLENDERVRAVVARARRKEGRDRGRGRLRRQGEERKQERKDRGHEQDMRVRGDAERADDRRPVNLVVSVLLQAVRR